MISLFKLVVVLPALTGWQPLAAVAMPADQAAGGDIYGGQPSQPHAFPYIVYLAYDGSQACNGVLLNANTIITTASCSYGVQPGDFSVRAGSVAWNTGGVVVNVARFLLHPQFDFNTGVNDIALWKLSAPIHPSKTISYVTLPAAQPNDPPVGAQVIIAGWGGTTYKPLKLPTNLRQATVPVAPLAACRASKELNATVVDANMICVGSGSKAGNQPGACAGDGGSPLVGAKSKTFWGLTSQFGHNCGEPGHYDIYTRVTKFVDWINKNKF